MLELERQIDFVCQKSSERNYLAQSSATKVQYVEVIRNTEH